MKLIEELVDLEVQELNNLFNLFNFLHMKNKKPNSNITMMDITPNVDNISMPEEVKTPDTDNIIIDDN
jgi:hypothetical protein